MPRGDGTGPRGRGPWRGMGPGRGPGRQRFLDFFRKTPATHAACRPAGVEQFPLAVVDLAQCTGCGVCADVCSFSAVTMENQQPVVNPFRCAGCGACANPCPKSAITLKER